MIERYAPSARSDRYGSRINRDRSPWRAVTVPYITIMLCSALPFVILADVMPIMPPLGFLMFVSWRIMRPGLMPIWAGAPLGAFDDLLSGQPFGSAVVLWSVAMIVLEVVENRFPWRGFWQDWFTAGLAVLFYIAVSMVICGAPLTVPMAMAALPQAVIAIIIYPFLARGVAQFDRFRLSRTRRIG